MNKKVSVQDLIKIRSDEDARFYELVKRFLRKKK